MRCQRVIGAVSTAGETGRHRLEVLLGGLHCALRGSAPLLELLVAALSGLDLRLLALQKGLVLGKGFLQRLLGLPLSGYDIFAVLDGGFSNSTGLGRGSGRGRGGGGEGGGGKREKADPTALQDTVGLGLTSSV